MDVMVSKEEREKTGDDEATVLEQDANDDDGDVDDVDCGLVAKAEAEIRVKSVLLLVDLDKRDCVTL